jgi:hypothetical protein
MKIFFLIITSVCFSLASEVHIDSKTELMWQDNTVSKYTKEDWQGAVKLCQELHLAGYDDWRLPTVKEIETIITISQDTPPVENGFKNIGGSGYYWTSSEHESSEAFAWMMNFKRGYEYSNYKTYERHVRCVRGEFKK